MSLETPSNPQIETPEALKKLLGREVSFYWLRAYRHLDENGNTAHLPDRTKRISGTVVTDDDNELSIRLTFDGDKHHDMPVKVEHFSKYEFESNE